MAVVERIDIRPLVAHRLRPLRERHHAAVAGRFAVTLEELYEVLFFALRLDEEVSLEVAADAIRDGLAEQVAKAQRLARAERRGRADDAAAERRHGSLAAVSAGVVRLIEQHAVGRGRGLEHGLEARVGCQDCVLVARAQPRVEWHTSRAFERARLRRADGVVRERLAVLRFLEVVGNELADEHQRREHIDDAREAQRARDRQQHSRLPRARRHLERDRAVALLVRAADGIEAGNLVRAEPAGSHAY